MIATRCILDKCVILSHPCNILQREDVLKNMERRKKQLETLKQQTKETLARHYDGTERIEDEEKERLEKRLDIIDRKLERMDDVDEREIERMQRREERRWERRRDREL